MTQEEPLAKRRKHEGFRSINTNLHELTLATHPLNIKPSGNQILASEDELLKLSHSTGSFFRHLSDDLIFQILGYLDKSSLFKLSHVSKFFYGFTSSEELWRSLYTLASTQERTTRNLEFTTWTGSWRSSIMRFPASTYEIDCGFIYSDLLFVPYANSQIDYNVLFQSFIHEQKSNIQTIGYLDAKKYPTPNHYPVKGRIPRLEESTLDYSTFESEWSNHPFIVGSNTPDINRWSHWTIEWLSQHFPQVKFRQESVQWPLSLYFDYSNKNIDESPLYLFDCRSQAFSQLIPTKGGYYPKPPCFAPCDNDMFTVFQDSRPDHTWLITGPKRSGSTWHKDPNSTDAWNVVLQGSKLWVMFPPECKPPGVFTDDNEGEVMSPIGVAEWVKSGYWNDSIKMINETKCGGVIGITYPGECIYVPSGWWHTVINIDDGVALTGNFVPSCKLGKVLKFMKDKSDQVSGFRHDKLQRFMKKFLEQQIVDDHVTEAQANRRKAIENYLTKAELKNEDEDVGVLGGTDCMPVYESFVELLLANGYEAQLQNGLLQMDEINREERRGLVKRSETWDKLTSVTNDQTFSFGFQFHEEEPDDE